MNARWRMLQRPDSEHHPVDPELRDALGLWLLGTLWTLAVLGLVLRGERHLVPMLLGTGLLAMWAWGRADWVSAVPTAALLFIAMDRLAAGRPGGRLGYVDVLFIAVALIEIARFVAIRRGRTAATRHSHQVVLPFPVAFGVVLAMAPAAGAVMDWIRPSAIGLALFFSSRAATARRGPWAWHTLTLAIACTSVWMALDGTPDLRGAFGIGGVGWRDVASSPTGGMLPLLTLASGLATGFLWPAYARSRQ
jgi:hypothetical protein